ncbi:MAG TPA: glycosyl hydrolase family 28-related protein, partial [Gemmatimonadales bacterium]
MDPSRRRMLALAAAAVCAACQPGTAAPVNNGEFVPGTKGLIPPERITVWNPGVPGGIPVRTTVCATISASTYGNGTTDAAAAINSALAACPSGQVVMLPAGTYLVKSPIQLFKSNVVLRG